MLGHLRDAGHRVSLVRDLDEAHALLGTGGFDQAVLSASTLSGLLEEHFLWESTDADSWRMSIWGLACDLQNLLHSLEQGIAPGPIPSEDTGLSDMTEVRHTISVLGGYLAELTGELSATADSELHLSAIDLEDAIEAAAITVYPSAADRRQRLVIDVDKAVASVRADGLKLKRILSILLAYASGQTPSLGRVAVRAYYEHEEPVICISYAGEEMTRSELRRLFGPADKKDSSIGLARVQRLVGQHGCRLWLESERGVATSLFLALPWWSDTASDRHPSLMHD